MKRIAADVGRALEFDNANSPGNFNSTTMINPFQERTPHWFDTKHIQCIDDGWLFRKCCFIDVGQIVRHVKSNPQYCDLRQDLLALAQGRPIILDAGTDPWAPTQLQHIIQSQGLDSTIILTPDRQFATQFRHQGFRWFPTWIIKAANTHHFRRWTLPEDFWQQRQHHVSCLNRLPRLHRFYTYYLINQYSWASDVYLSFGGFQPTGPRQDYFWINEIKQKLGTEFVDFFQQHHKFWPIKWDTEYQWSDVIGQHDHLTPAYKMCYTNIVTETSNEIFCPTEKTTKPLQSGNLFVAVASAGHMAAVSDMGFQVDFTGIDYRIYDNEPNWKRRAELGLELVNTVYHDIPDIWRENLSRLQHNCNLFRSAELTNRILNDVQDIICL